MRIGFDGRYIQDRYHGIGRYAFELLRHQLARPSDDQYVILWNPSLQNTRFDLDALLADPRVIPVPTRTPLFSPLDQILLPWLAQRQRLDLWHAPYFAVPLLLPCPLVVTVHDLIFERYPVSVPRRSIRAYHSAMMRLGLRRAARVAVVSEATRRDLLALYPIAASKISVTYEATDGNFQPADAAAVAAVRARYALPERYILCVGVRRPHKNIGVVVRALGQLRDRVDHDLVLVGGVDTRFHDDLPELIDAAGLTGRVHELGQIPEGDLPAMYAGAAAYICPSWIEGFGLPVIEAFACGAPVIVSDRPSLPEVVGDAALLFDPADATALAAALSELLTDTKLADCLRQRGFARAASFSWSRLADETSALYMTVGDGLA